MSLNLKAHGPKYAMCTYFGDEYVYPIPSPKLGGKLDIPEIHARSISGIVRLQIQ